MEFLRSPSPSLGLTFNAPSHPTSHKVAELRIQVPNDSESPPNSTLGDPILMVPSFGFDKITQLPTPVLQNGLFQPYQLEVQKRAPGGHSGTRVMSEFDPRIKRTAAPEPAQTIRRFSNPSQIPHEDTMPLPPIEAESTQYQGQIFEAPHLGEFEFEQVVGSGAFSTVVSASPRKTVSSKNSASSKNCRPTYSGLDVVAVKIVAVPTENAGEVSNFRRYICRELGILSHLQHPCIVKLLDYNVNLSITQAEIDQGFGGPYTEPPVGSDMYDYYTVKLQNKQIFFMGYCKGGNLFQWLFSHHKPHSHSTGFWKLMARIVAELVLALAYLHSHDVVHRDVKLENVLLNHEYDSNDNFDFDEAVCTLTDFGLSKKLDLPTQLLSTKCGSQDYVSPELLMGLQYSGKLLDAWSLGALIYAILEDRLPFDAPPLEYLATSGVSPSVLKRRRSKHNPAHRIAMIDWDWFAVTAFLKDDTVPQEAKEIVQQLSALVDVLLVRKDRRLSAAQLLGDDRFLWIKKTVPLRFYEC